MKIEETHVIMEDNLQLTKISCIVTLLRSRRTAMYTKETDYGWKQRNKLCMK